MYSKRLSSCICFCNQLTQIMNTLDEHLMKYIDSRKTFSMIQTIKETIEGFLICLYLVKFIIVLLINIQNIWMK